MRRDLASQARVRTYKDSCVSSLVSCRPTAEVHWLALSLSFLHSQHLIQHTADMVVCALLLAQLQPACS